MDRESRETWAKRVERWKDSGLTAKEYAAELGVNAHSLSWWKWRLSSAPGESGRRPRKARRPDTAAPLTFVELPAASAEPLEVVLPSSLRVRVPSGFDATALRRLLDVLVARQ
ncbi:MAG: IS66 family insertion sequence element accessory protein TnpA [Polyangiaceae bacterium]